MMTNKKANHFRNGLRISIAYLLVLAVLLLAPFDFHMPIYVEENNVRWIDDQAGVEFASVGSIRSSSSPVKLYKAMVSGEGLSLEVWAAAGNAQQRGPARIVSYSTDKGFRNFTLGQEREDLVMRLRTTETDPNGMIPQLVVRDVFRSSGPQHIVVRYDFSEQQVYVNGQRRMKSELPGGVFSNWDPSYSFVLGNEATGNRPWVGKLFLVAIYNRSLSEEEILKNYAAGVVSNSAMHSSDGRVKNGLVSLYSFTEGRGDRVLDRSGSESPIDLTMPRRIVVTNDAFLAGLYREFNFQDLILNVALFIPFGLLFHTMLANRYGSSLKIAAFVLIAGTLFSLIIESLQYFTVTRFSSMADVLGNVIGTALGISINKTWGYFVKGVVRQSEGGHSLGA